jgi:hypothetical protein
VKFVVESGLKEGEEVIMNPRTHFAEEIARLEAESVKKAQEARRKSGETAKANGDGPSERSGSDSPQNRQGGNATAQRPPNGGQGFNREAFFARQDANGDGELSGDEISDRMKQGLSRLDKNGDGKLSKEEFMAAKPPGEGGRPPGPPNGGRNTRGAE